MSSEKTSGRRRPSFWLWGTLVLVLALIVLLAVLPKPQEQTETEAEKPVAVRTLEIVPQTFEDALLLPGRIEALQDARLGAQRAGQVVEILADKGESVEEGQVLLRLDSRLWEAAQKRAKIEVRDAKRDLKRWKKLEKSGAVSASDYEGIQRRKESAEIALEEAEVMVSQCEVRSPFAGVIVDRGVEVGDYATEGLAVLEVIRLDRVKVMFDVPEQDVSALQPGQSKSFTLAALPGREFKGEVTFVSSQAGRASNSFAAELEAENADGSLKSGMIAQVALVRREREGAVLVPLAAVVPRKGEHYVFAVENDRAVRKRVLLGALVGHEAVLESGVVAGERIVVEGHRGLQDGQPVSEGGDEGELPEEDMSPEEAEPTEEESTDSAE